MQAARNIAARGVNFIDSLTACDICKINKSSNQPIRTKQGKTEITESLQLISADRLGPVSPLARGNYWFMAKYADHYTKFNAVYFLSRTDKALTTLVNTCPALPPVLACRRRRRVHRRLLQQVLQDHIDYPEVQITHHTPERNGLRERNGRTVMDVAWSLLNKAVLPKSI